MIEHSKLLRGALLGCGQVAKHHMKAWQETEGVKIVALCNRTISKAETLGGEFGISFEHVYGDYQELFEKEPLDFIDIATAPQMHRQQVETAADYGLNIFCQKPFADTLEDARAMIHSCERAGVLFAINENWRWRSWYRELKQMLEANLIGRPRYIRIARHSDIALPSPDGNLPPLFLKQPYTTEMDKLIVYEWGIHLVDIVRFLFGEIKSVYAIMDKVNRIGKGEDRAYMIIEVGEGYGLIDISWSTIVDNSPASLLEHVTLEGEKGTIELLPGCGDILRVTCEKGKWQQPALHCSPEEAYQDSYTAAHRHFIDCLRTNRSPETVASDNIKTLAAALASYQSAATHQPVIMEI